MMQHRTAHSRLPNYLVNSQSIKPSVSFMNLGREQQKINHFVDLQDGPSSLQKRPGIPTVKEQGGASLPYERERSEHLSTMTDKLSQLDKARSTLFTFAGQDSKMSLTTPSAKRAELAEIKQQLTAYKEFKEKQQFLTKRDRVLSQGWRHGILGVDDADSAQPQVFYQTTRDQKDKVNTDKDLINKRRTRCKLIKIFICFATFFSFDHVIHNLICSFRTCSWNGNKRATANWI